MENWTIFVDTLPQKMIDYLARHVGEVNDFKLTFVDAEENMVSFYSDHAEIEVDYFQSLIGFSLSIWYPDAEKNNESGDPSHTDHEMFIQSPLAFLKHKDEKGGSQ